MSALQDKHRLVIVTGKGGVGKSLLAAALAEASVRRGLRTLLVTLNVHDERHPILGVPLGYEPRQTSRGFYVNRIEPFQAAAEYATSRLPLGALYRTFFRSRAFREFAAAAPGFEELACLGELYKFSTDPAFDRVVFDAPATGHLKNLLAVPSVVLQTVRVGELNHNARRIEDLLLDSERCRVVVTTLAEEMPVTEALETIALCRDRMRMGLGPVLVNRLIGRRFSEGEIERAEARVRAGGLSATAEQAVQAARDELTEQAAQQQSLLPLRQAAVTLVDVPRIVQRHYDADALLTEAAGYIAPALGRPAAAAVAAGVGATSRSRSEPPQSGPGGPSHREPGPGGPSHKQSGPGGPSHNVPLDLPALVRGHRVIVCCGSGGVGKTTSAAALGVLAARAGLNVQVMTIDPARRLAQAMGLDILSHEPQTVPLDAPGQLSAMMLDSKRAFDRLVEIYAPDPRVRDAIFANHYYQQLSTSLGGSKELAAMERVLEVAAEDDHDLLIVDTPPSQHALDFLNAPERLIKLLDGSMLQWLLRPYGMAARVQFDLFRHSSATALKFLERITGVGLLADLSDFLLAFSGMFDGFRQRAQRVGALMRDPSTAFLLVCAPEPASLSQVELFRSRLAGEGMTVAGVLANRVHPPPGGADVAADAARVPELGGEALAALAAAGDPAFSSRPLPDRLARAWIDAVDACLADREALAGVAALPLHTVPQLTGDLHGMPDLARFADLLAS